MPTKKKMPATKQVSPKNVAQKVSMPKTSLNFKNEPWYEKTFNSMAVSIRKPNEVRFNFLSQR